MPLDFSPYQAVLLDLDGTIYHEDQPLPGAIELVRRLQQEDRNFACLSNSSASPLRVMARLEDMGLDLDPNNIYTAAAAACDYVLDQFPLDALSDVAGSAGEEVAARVWGSDEPDGEHVADPDASMADDRSTDDGRTSQVAQSHDSMPRDSVTASDSAASDSQTQSASRRRPRIYNLATESVDEMLQGLVDWVTRGEDQCDAIIVGPPSSRFATEERQRTALQLARHGAAVVGICADRVYPSPRGIEFGAGSLAWMLAYAANIEPTFCGKPEKIFFHELCQRLKAQPEWCLLVGDNLESDVCGGKSVGMRTVLTLSGVTRRDELVKVPEELRPDLVVEDLRELV